LNPQLSHAPQEGEDKNAWLLEAAIQCLRTKTSAAVLFLACTLQAAYAEEVDSTIHNVGITQFEAGGITFRLENTHVDIVQNFIRDVLELQESWNNIIPNSWGKTIVQIMEGLNEAQFNRVIAYYGAISNPEGSAVIEALTWVSPELTPEDASMPTPQQFQLLFPGTEWEVIEAFSKWWDNLPKRHKSRMEKIFTRLLYPSQKFMLESFADAMVSDVKTNGKLIVTFLGLIADMEALSRYANLREFPKSGQLPDAIKQLNRARKSSDAYAEILKRGISSGTSRDSCSKRRTYSLEKCSRRYGKSF